MQCAALPQRAHRRMLAPPLLGARCQLGAESSVKPTAISSAHTSWNRLLSWHGMAARAALHLKYISGVLRGAPARPRCAGPRERGGNRARGMGAYVSVATVVCKVCAGMAYRQPSASASRSRSLHAACCATHGASDGQSDATSKPYTLSVASPALSFVAHGSTFTSAIDAAR